MADSRALSSRAWTNQEIKPCMYIRTNIESIPLWYSKNEHDCPWMVTANGSPSFQGSKINYAWGNLHACLTSTVEQMTRIPLDRWRVELCKFERDICNFKAVYEYWILVAHLDDSIIWLQIWYNSWRLDDECAYIFLFFMQGHSTLVPHFVASCVHSFCFHTGEGALMARLG